MAARAAERRLLESVPAWLCSRPAALLGLDTRKGAIAIGADADFVVWDPDTKFVVPTTSRRSPQKRPPDGAPSPPPAQATLYGTLADGSIFEGATLRGVVRATYVRGRCVYASAPPAPPAEAATAPHRITGLFREHPIGEALDAPAWSAHVLEPR